MITAKEAVESAKKYLIDLNGNQQLKDLALEGVSFHNGPPSAWRVVLGYYEKRNISSFGSTTIMPSNTLKLIENRVYKTIEVQADDGQFLALNSRFADLP
ncbi:MAG: hypothetical protein QM533_06245 [Cytophagales bacterium]|nr:hypothetical protein [Cytophagales bacterium]